MKKIASIIAVFAMMVLPLMSIGQVPPPPNQHGETTNQAPGTQGGAPLGGGMAMLLAMGAAYGGKRYYDYRKKLKSRIED
jgi:hypothetical protein